MLNLLSDCQWRFLDLESSETPGRTAWQSGFGEALAESAMARKHRVKLQKHIV